MADPEGYDPQYDFSAFQTTNPTKPLPGHELDVELQNISEAIGQTQTALSDIRRPDGQLQNGIVTLESAAEGFVEGILELAEGALSAIDGYGEELTFFSQVWLGAHPSDPTTGLADNPLFAGQMYYNTVANEYRVYNGSAWQFHTGLTQMDSYIWSATSGQTVFSGVDGGGKVVSLTTGALLVYAAGTGPLREGVDYDVLTGGDGIEFVTGRTAGDKVQIVSFRQLNITNIAPQVASDADRAEAAVTQAEAAADAATASALAIGGRFFASEAAFKAQPVDPLVDMVFVRYNTEILAFARQPGANTADDIQHPDGSDWAKSSLSASEVSAAITAALSSAVSRAELLDEDDFLPTITFATPADMTITYGAIRRGYWWRTNKRVDMLIEIVDATLTKNSASGKVRIGFGAAGLTPSLIGLGGGVVVNKNNGIRQPIDTELGVEIGPGNVWVELTHRVYNGTTQYITDAHVLSGAQTVSIKLNLWFTVD